MPSVNITSEMIQDAVRAGLTGRHLGEAIRARRALGRAWEKINVGGVVAGGLAGGVLGSATDSENRFGGFMRGALFGAGAVASLPYIGVIRDYLGRRGSVGTMTALKQLFKSEEELVGLTRGVLGLSGSPTTNATQQGAAAAASNAAAQATAQTQTQVMPGGTVPAWQGGRMGVQGHFGSTPAPSPAAPGTIAPPSVGGSGLGISGPAVP